MPSRALAVYPGSFDPITNGHVDIVLRSAQIFDRVIVLLAVNSQKNSLFTIEERLALLREVFADHKNIEVDFFEGLLVDYLKNHKMPVIIRGLRAVSDFEYEFQMALMNRKINPQAETFFMAAGERWTYVSSRIVKEVFSLGACIEELAPKPVIKAMREKFAK